MGFLIFGCRQATQVQNSTANQSPSTANKTPTLTPEVNNSQTTSANQTPPYPPNNASISTNNTPPQDLDMIDKIEFGEREVHNATAILGVRSSNIILDCNGICFSDSFQIFQDDAHLNCQGRKIRPENNAQVALVIEANNVSVVNCDISNFDIGIKILGSGNIIADNTITNNSKGGIVIEGDNNRVFNNNIRDNKWANIEIKAGSEKNIIFNNTMIDTPDIYQPYAGSLAAIGILGSDNIVLDNVIKNTHEIGIKLTPLVVEAPAPSRNFVARNIIENSGVLALEITGAVVKDAKTNTPATQNAEGQNIIFNNTLTSSKNEFGLRIRWSNQNKIIKNSIYDNRWQGIHILSANGNLIERNVVCGNQEGIWLGDAYNNTIFSNVISNSVEHCGVVLTDWNNSTSSSNTIKSNTLVSNGNMHDNKQICDEDNNTISENEFG